MSVLSLPDNMQVQLTYAYPTDAEGVAITGTPPTWASTDESVLVVTADDASGMTAHAVPVVAPGAGGNLGDASVTASTDLQDGTTDTADFDITVVASAEVSPGTITAGTPEPR